MAMQQDDSVAGVYRNTSEGKKLSNGINQFAWDLYSQMSSAKPRENVFFSPASVAITLGMTYLGARENTAMEMMKVYKFFFFFKRQPSLGILQEVTSVYRYIA